MLRVLLTTTSFQDTTGAHQDLLAAQAFEVLRERGPLPERRMLELAGQFDAFLCGDDEITAAVLDKARPRLQVISKYGVGLDKIDLVACTLRGVPVLYTPGVNHATVAEHSFCLLLALARRLIDCVEGVRAGEWKRLTGHELFGKRIGIVGLGRIGQEVARRAVAFGMQVHALTPHWPESFARETKIEQHQTIASLLPEMDVVSLHTGLTNETRHLLNGERFAQMKPGALLVNTARAELVDLPALLHALATGNLGGYGTDVLEAEPPPPDHPLLRHPRVIVTPHIGSRTFESVPRQAMRALLNLINFLKGDPDIIQANKIA